MSTPSPELSRRDLAFREEHGGFSLILKRNCSITPAGLACVFAALAVVVLAIGIGFAVAGAWLILPFAGLEVLLLGAAFMWQARHATDYERIALEDGRLTVEVGEAQRVARYEVEARRARIEMKGSQVVLRGLKDEKQAELKQDELELGRHLDAHTRVAFAAELGKRLRI